MQKGTRFFIPLIFLIGSGIILTVFFYLKKEQTQYLHSHLQEGVLDYYHDLQQEVALTIESIYEIKGVYESSTFVTREEFSRAARSILKRHPSIQALEWIPRVPETERIAYETRARNEGFPGFSFTRHEAQGQMVPDIERNEYFPVYYMEPYKGNEAAFGFNLGSHPGRLKALQKAYQTGRPVASEAITLVQEHAHQKGFLIFLPVYRSGDPSKANFLGFALGVFRVTDIVHSALPTQYKNDAMALWLYDGNEDSENLLLHTPAPSGTVKNNDFDQTRTLEVADRKWLLVARPSNTFLKEHMLAYPYWFLFLALLALMILFYAYVTKITQLQKLKQLNSSLNEAEMIGHMGHWEITLPDKQIRMTGEILKAYGLDERMLPVPLATVLQSVHADDRRDIETTLSQMITDGTPRTLEIRIVSESMGERIINIQGRVEYEDQKPVRIIGIAQDVTQQRERERNILLNENYLQTVFDTEPDILVTTHGDKIDRCNAKMLEFAGFDDLESFKKEYACICDLFEKRAGFLQKEMNDMNWLEYLYAHPDQIHKVVMTKEGVEHVFRLSAKRLQLDEKHRSLVVLSDITPIETAQKELREAKETTELYLKTAQIMLMALDREGRITMINPKGCEILGFEQHDLIGKKWFDCCVPPGIHDEIKDVFNKCLQDTQTLIKTYENEILRSDGSRRQIHWLNAQLKNASGEIIGILSSGEDITEHRQTEERLKLFRTLLDNSGDAVEVLDPDTLHFLDVNTTAYRALGYTREELLAMSVYDIDTLFTPESTEAVQQQIQQAGNVRFESIHRRKDGTTFPVEINTTLIQLDRPYILSIARDITERKAAEAALAESEQRFKMIFEGARDGILLADINSRKFAAGNARICQMLGYTLDELQALGIEDIHPKKDLPQVRNEFEKQAKGEVELAARLPVLRKDGSIFYSDINSFPIQIGGDAYLVGFFRDITERIKMEEELNQKEEMMLAQSRQAAMGDMIAMIAHQWRQPITVIAMAVNNIRLHIDLDETLTKESVLQMTDTVTDQTQHLSKTIDDFRNFFRPNKAKEKTTINAVIEGTLQIIGKSLENNNIDVKVADRSDYEILTYPNELLQVFLNILGNAKDVLKNIEDARIRISIEESEEAIRTSFCDNGGGISGKIIKHLGEPYVTTKGKSGTGLGLYMSKTIVERHLGGTLSWENRDEGACFTVTLKKEEEENP